MSINIDKLSKLSNEELLRLLLKARLDSKVISESTTNPHSSQDNILLDNDFYSSVKEYRYDGIHHGCELLELKRIGISGLKDMHWVGFYDSAQPESWHERKSIGAWLIG